MTVLGNHLNSRLVLSLLSALCSELHSSSGSSVISAPVEKSAPGRSAEIAAAAAFIGERPLSNGLVFIWLMSWAGVWRSVSYLCPHLLWGLIGLSGS